MAGKGWDNSQNYWQIFGADSLVSTQMVQDRQVQACQRPNQPNLSSYISPAVPTKIPDPSAQQPNW